MLQKRIDGFLGVARIDEGRPKFDAAPELHKFMVTPLNNMYFVT